MCTGPVRRFKRLCELMQGALLNSRCHRSQLAVASDNLSSDGSSCSSRSSSLTSDRISPGVGKENDSVCILVEKTKVIKPNQFLPFPYKLWVLAPDVFMYGQCAMNSIYVYIHAILLCSVICALGTTSYTCATCNVWAAFNLFSTSNRCVICNVYAPCVLHVMWVPYMYHVSGTSYVWYIHNNNSGSFDLI